MEPNKFGVPVEEEVQAMNAAISTFIVQGKDAPRLGFNGLNKVSKASLAELPEGCGEALLGLAVVTWSHDVIEAALDVGIISEEMVAAVLKSGRQNGTNGIYRVTKREKLQQLAIKENRSNPLSCLAENPNLAPGIRAKLLHSQVKGARVSFAGRADLKPEEAAELLERYGDCEWATPIIAYHCKNLKTIRGELLKRFDSSPKVVLDMWRNLVRRGDLPEAVILAFAKRITRMVGRGYEEYGKVLNEMSQHRGIALKLQAVRKKKESQE